MTPNQAASLWQDMMSKFPQGAGMPLQQGLMEGWTKAFQQFQNMDLGSFGALGQGAGAPDLPNLTFPPEKLLELQQNYVREASELWNQTLQANPPLKDRRFKSEAWTNNPLSSFTAAVYLLNARTLMAMAEVAEGDEKSRQRDAWVLSHRGHAVANGVRARLSYDEKSHRPVLDELNERLVDKYFVNFSVFESIPDVWAIDQVFPIVPIERLNERPDRRGIVADMTCDSDGMVETYVENESLDSSLPLHAVRHGESYRIGFFLVGAYQEILGDIHNLFGDTDAVEVRLTEEGGYELTQQRRGDTTDVMLDYVGYGLDELRAIYARRLREAALAPAEADAIAAALEAGLTGYTYLSDQPQA